MQVAKHQGKKLTASLEVTLHGVPSHAHQPIVKRKLKTVIQKFKTSISEAYDIDENEILRKD